MIKKMNLVGVGDVRAYDGDMLVLNSQAMINTTIEVSTGSTEIASGKRNKLDNIYYHSGRLNITLETSEWNMNWISANSGGITTSWIRSAKQSIALDATGKGTITAVSAVPLKGSKQAYGWYKNDNGMDVRVTIDADGTFTTADATSFSTTQCINFYIVDPDASSITIPASIIPKRLNVFINVDISSNTTGEGISGFTEFNIPAMQLSGAQTINMTSDGYSTIPLSGMALAFTPPTSAVNACSSGDVYAIVTTVINNTKWYDNVVSIGIYGGSDFKLKVAGGINTRKLDTIAIKGDGTTVPAPSSGLTYTSGTQSTATVSADGTVTAVATGTSLITVKITDVPTISIGGTVTVSA